MVSVSPSPLWDKVGGTEMVPEVPKLHCHVFPSCKKKATVQHKHASHPSARD